MLLESNVENPGLAPGFLVKYVAPTLNAFDVSAALAISRTETLVSRGNVF
jgi:hypothetical protein